MRVRGFLPMQSPLVVGTPDGPVVALAFVVGPLGGLGVFAVPFDGGTASILPMGRVRFPAPIASRPLAESVTTLGRAARRAELRKPGRVEAIDPRKDN